MRRGEICSGSERWSALEMNQPTIDASFARHRDGASAFTRGVPVNLTMGPADVDAGFIFVRTDAEGNNRELRANAGAVIATEFATVLGDRQGCRWSPPHEHVLAALRGMGVDNATIEVDGPEVPIMDGSAAAFVAAIDPRRYPAASPPPRRFIEVLKPIQIERSASPPANCVPMPAGSAPKSKSASPIR